MKAMKKVQISKATAPLAEYVEIATKEPLVIVKNGLPVAVLVGIEAFDLKKLSENPDLDFLTLVEWARAR